MDSGARRLDAHVPGGGGMPDVKERLKKGDTFAGRQYRDRIATATTCSTI